MFRFLSPVKPLIALAIAWLLIYMALEITSVKLPRDAVNIIQNATQSDAARQLGIWGWIKSTEPTAQQLRHVIFLLVGVVIVLGITRYLKDVSNSKLSMNMVYYIREAVYDKIQRVGFGFHDTISTGQLINRALSDLQNVRSFVQTGVLVTLEIILTVVGYIILFYSLNKMLAVIALVPLPVWVWYILRFSKKIQPKVKAALESEDRNVSIITENIAGVHVVKAFATEKQEIDKYATNCSTFKERVLSRIRMFADFNPYIRAIAQSSYVLLFIFTEIQVLRGQMLIGDFMSLFMGMGAILGRLQMIANINEQYQNAIVSARRLHEVLTAPPTVPEKEDAKDLPPGPGEVVFENVSFAYKENKPVLNNISFRAKGGAIVAIVGPTGSGKSTLVNLIARYYTAQTGRILVDGHDIADVTLSSLRKNVGFVFQETYLFSDTIAANIAYGRPGISRGEIEAAARLAQAHDFIEPMGKGYDTVLAERGSSLSGGQKQRLAIARAMVTNPRILVLDDATAAIDPETEDLIRRGLRLTLYGRTTFIIAHRISTVKQADLVIVLESGRITQMGTHDQLMQQDGHYRDIAEVQLYGDEERTGEESPSHMKRLRKEKSVEIAAQQADVGENKADEPWSKAAE
jgi:ATP-binding cassette subfamily B protein